MTITFSKYQGTGNDFILIDNREKQISILSNKQIQQLCNRRFGIGADGLMLIQRHKKYDFEVVYYNSDGSQSFCGNGARCATHFAHTLGVFDEKVKFWAIDGCHQATLTEKDQIAVKMNDVDKWIVDKNAVVLNTGSPHYINFVDDLEKEDFLTFCRTIRYAEPYQKEGINVNLARVQNDVIHLLTYERGVEAETLSCGTGATAVALAHALLQDKKGAFSQKIKVKGGDLLISADFDGTSFTDIYLIGPAKHVFNGAIAV